MFLNGLDCWKKNVAESVSDKVQQICGLVVRAEKCLLAGHLGKLPGSQGQRRSHPRVTWHLPSQSLIQPNLRQGILWLSLNHVQTALFLFGRVYYLRECVSTCLKIFFLYIQSQIYYLFSICYIHCYLILITSCKAERIYNPILHMRRLFIYGVQWSYYIERYAYILMHTFICVCVCK